MLLLSKHKHPLTAVTLLALVASTSLSWSRWSKGDDTFLYLSERRGLSADQEQHVPDQDNVYERNYQSLVAKGHDPNSVSFQRILDRRIGRRMDKVSTNQVKRARNNDTRKLRSKSFIRSRVRELLSKHEAQEHINIVMGLKNTRDIWKRGDFLKTNTPGLWLSNAHLSEEEVMKGALADGTRVEKHDLQKLDKDYKPLSICDRPTDVNTVEDYDLLPYQHGQCPEITKDKPILLLKYQAHTYGRTGNNLVEFLHALQLARDQNAQLGLMVNAWPFEVITRMWFPIGDGEVDLASWESKFEEAFCVKIFPILSNPMGDGWDVIERNTKELLLYGYKIEAPLSEYVANSSYDIRTLFRHINRGVGHASDHRPVRDMCSGITSIFGEARASAIYSVIHSRTFAAEEAGAPGIYMMNKLNSKSGVDPLGALEMKPDYVKSILEPLGMMNYPIAFLTDNQDPQIFERLMADPDIGPLLILVPEEDCWFGGDITLAAMSNVFIGNPASSFSSFIAKSRMALGFAHSYLFRAKDTHRKWRTVCGDHCVFDGSIMGINA